MNNLRFRIVHLLGMVKFVYNLVRVRIRFFIRRNFGA